eukprot:TRINITY_DN11327_c0_g1_i1.p2 TRINITY_DN11327_c0_g1~~TRINITY_DN11327_c0_g1_i1.p2  ORF type:complete len:171 (+),score=52.24 TRINITY_DN11327_c0_g1_i1:134-646(+)
MIRRPPRSTQSRSSAASDVYKRQIVDPAAIRGNMYAVHLFEFLLECEGHIECVACRPVPYTLDVQAWLSHILLELVVSIWRIHKLFCTAVALRNHPALEEPVAHREQLSTTLVGLEELLHPIEQLRPTAALAVALQQVAPVLHLDLLPCSMRQRLQLKFILSDGRRCCIG